MRPLQRAEGVDHDPTQSEKSGLEKTGLQRTAWVRFLTAAVVVIVLVVTISGIALPYAISTDLVKDRLERRISELSGQQVELLARPKVGFWPVPYIELKRVKISSRQAGVGEPIIFADQIKADFSILSALTGDPNFSNFVLVRPVIRLERFASGGTSWQSDGGRISEAIAITERNGENQNDTNAQPAVIPDYRLGDVSIQNGTFYWIDESSGRQEKVTSLNGLLGWPRLGGGLRANLNGIVGGEAVSVNFSTDKPLDLLSRRNAPVDVELTASPLSFSFDGTVNLSDKPYFGGELALQSSSVRKVLEWAGTKIRPGEAIGAISLDAEVEIQHGRSVLDKLILEMEGNRGIGVLDIEYSDPERPGITGTLAFSSLDVMSFLRAFTPLPRSGDEISSTIDTSFLYQLSLDLRLSAQSASLGPLELSNLAAAGRIAEGRATFDIGDATAYGGRVLGRMMLAEKGIEGGGGIKFSARDINLEDALAALDFGGPLIEGVGSVEVTLSSKYPAWATAARDLDGKLLLTISDGAIPAFNLDEFRKNAASEQFFDLSTVSSGSFPFQSAEISVDLANGQARLEKGEIVAPNARFELAGIIPYVRGGLALVGTLTDGPPPENEQGAEEESDAAEPQDVTRFFVGGSWTRPVISPFFGP